MKVTRADFLKMVSVATGLGVAGGVGGVGGGTEAEAIQAPPASAGGGLDSQRFRQAVADGDLAEVRRYLERDPALALSRDEKGRSMLVVAWLGGHKEVADLLKERTAATVGLDLVEAVLVGDLARAQALGDKFPNLVNEPHPFGGTPVHAAVRAGQAAAIFRLLTPGPDFNALSTDPAGFTPYRMAIDYPDRAVAEDLVDAIAGNGGDPNVKQGDGTPLLHAAAAAGSVEMLRLLILNGADLDARDAQGATALAVAEGKGNQEAAELLRRADRLPRNHRTSRFAYTAGGQRFEKKDNPPLPQPVINRYVSVSHGNLEAMKGMLASYPSLLHANASWDELAVEAGAHVGFKPGVQFLLDQGAPLSLPTAAMMGRLEPVKVMLAEDPRRIWEHGAHNMPVMWYPAIGIESGAPDYLEIAKLLVQAGADVNAHKNGRTALHWAAEKGDTAMADFLLSHGADPNARMKRDGGQVTALALAEKGGHAAVAELLRKAGATA